MIEKDVKDFGNSAKCQIRDGAYVEGDFKVRDHYYITGKYRISAQRDCNIKVKLNYKIPKKL